MRRVGREEWRAGIGRWPSRFAGLLLLGVASLASAADKPRVVPTVAPELTARDATGATRRLSDLRGKVVVLNFWATWCAPCRSEIPALVEAWRRHRDRGVVFVGYASDGLSGKADVGKFLDEFGVGYPVWFGLSGGELESFGYDWSLPDTTVIDRDGRILASFRGTVTVEGLDAVLAPLEAMPRS